MFDKKVQDGDEDWPGEHGRIMAGVARVLMVGPGSPRVAEVEETGGVARGGYDCLFARMPWG